MKEHEWLKGEKEKKKKWIIFLLKKNPERMKNKK